MNLISLATAVTLTGWSERTFWRRFADGSVKRETDNEKSTKSRVAFESISPHVCIPLDVDEVGIVLQADRGSADAQNDLGLLFLSHDIPKSALYWFEMAARQDHSDAMHWLARCHMEGKGLEQDEDIGIMWLAKAAAYGHAISKAQIAEMKKRFVAPEG